MGNQDLYLPKLSFEYPYLDEGFHNENWDYGGDAVISNNNGIFLTQNLPSRRGWLWSIEHLPKESWEVSVDFTVGQGKPGLVGDGFAIWATKERVTSGPVFGNRDFFTGLGLFFDTYANSKEKLSFPIVAGMIGDGKTGYDFSSDGLKHSIGHCDKLFYRNQPTPSTARITYIRSKLLRVEIKVGNQDFVNCFSQNNVELPDDIYLGLSALTGDLSGAFQSLLYLLWPFILV
ncbi:L-type lectin-like domain-containing protein [Zancudomyces culisetae]|uniref:L-type lectin-like domain-containing protein n=1 Tax=Zancudomyces culisetae TaxID=1213189 RepID=A0A1R1PVD1_ZANCU|nr:L-type lectin-like domain-containing protein [Zancudomyces culisetae]|eukprot:OMH84920.1 L-type lectin-like domain-containing protein [Zancudomyces culisetae]